MVCAVSVILAINCRVCLHTTGNAWNITASEYCIPTSSSAIVLLLWLLCIAVSLSSHLRWWVPPFSICFNGVCSVSDLCYWLPCFLSTLLGMHQTWQSVSIASPHLLATLWCSCYVLLLSPSSHLRKWVPLFSTNSNGVCSVNDPSCLLACFISSLLGMHGT